MCFLDLSECDEFRDNEEGMAFVALEVLANRSAFLEFDVPGLVETYLENCCRQLSYILCCLSRSQFVISGLCLRKRGLTTKLIVVSFFKPFFKMDTAMAPFIPSKFSMKKPGRRILD